MGGKRIEIIDGKIKCRKCTELNPVDDTVKGRSICKKCANGRTREYRSRLSIDKLEERKRKNREWYYENFLDISTRRKQSNLTAGKRRISHLKMYDLSIDQYWEMYDVQDGSCKYCKTPEPLCSKRRLHIDHCKLTGRVRCLLCSRCNTGQGLFDHNPALLREAADFLDAFNS